MTTNPYICVRCSRPINAGYVNCRRAKYHHACHAEVCNVNHPTI